MSKTIFMTGATSGFGKISALKAANKGATLIVLARNKVKGQNLVEDFKLKFPDGLGKIDIVEGDLNSFESIQKACQEVVLKYPIIDLIVNNAGIMNFEPLKTVDGIEETFQVNFLSPLLICHLLFDSLKKPDSGKIIFTSSGLHKGEIDFENLEFENKFSSFKVYSQSKLAVILICRILGKSLKSQEISIYSQHPGMVRTELGRSAGWFSKLIFYFLGKSAEVGSETLTYLIESKHTELETGEYYANKKVTKSSQQSYDDLTAHKLMDVASTYLAEYVKKDSPFLSIKEI